jgi:hypothetical protein
MTITPDEDRPVDPYADLSEVDGASGEDASDEDLPSERPDADERVVPLEE